MMLLCNPLQPLTDSLHINSLLNFDLIICLGSFPDNIEYLFPQMKGRIVYIRAVEGTIAAVKEVLTKAQLTLEDLRFEGNAGHSSVDVRSSTNVLVDGLVDGDELGDEGLADGLAVGGAAQPLGAVLIASVLNSDAESGREYRRMSRMSPRK